MRVASRTIGRWCSRLLLRVARSVLLRDWSRPRDLDALMHLLATQRFTEQLAPVVSSGPTAARILVLAPHPDDDTLGAGGMLLLARQRGAAVHVVYMTSGEADPQSDTARAREREAAAVTSVIGATAEYWRYPTRSIPLDPSATNRLHAAFARIRPQAVVLPFLADDHPDHRQTAMLFAAAFRDAPPDADVWTYQVYSSILPTAVVDITDVMDEKLALVRRWESQLAKRDWMHYIQGVNAVQSRFLPTRSARYAEAFFVVPAAEYVALCERYRTSL